jgi:site-specific recombinase XerD
MSSTAVARTDHAEVARTDLTPDLAAATRYARAEKADATRKAYATDYRLFCQWCEARSLTPMPASVETVAAYLAHEAENGCRPSTIGRRCAAIRYAHKLAGNESPTSAEPIKATIRGIRRSLGTAHARKTPATADLILAMVSVAGTGPKGLRDRALMLLGFAGAFRRSELIALDVSDLRETEAGLIVTIRRSKTDQEGQGRTVAIVRGSIACPVQAVRSWLDAAKIEGGPLFRPVVKGGRIINGRLSDKQVARTVKAFATKLGLDVAAFGGHSLRTGFLTSAAARGASIFKMADQSGHKSMDTLRGYVRSAELFQDHAGAGLL